MEKDEEMRGKESEELERQEGKKVSKESLNWGAKERKEGKRGQVYKRASRASGRARWGREQSPIN